MSMAMTPQQFIASIAPEAVALYKQYRISAALQIAQACLESGYGQHAPGNNLFGIKAGAGWTGPTVTELTYEYVNGQWVKMSAKFRAYPSFADSLRDHVQMLATDPRYKNLIGADWETACRLIQQDGYATDPAYATKLISIIQQYGLDKYDAAAKEVANVLERGSKGEAVKQLQQDLNLVLGVHLAVDGVYGPATEAAVRAFQQQHHLAVDGIAGPQTLSALAEAVKAKQAVQPTNVLKRGSTGEAVKTLQQELNEVLGTHLAVDGIFGPATEAAVREFQQQHHLTVDGIVGPQTLNALAEAVKAKQAVQPKPQPAPAPAKPNPADVAKQVDALLDQAKNLLKQLQ